MDLKKKKLIVELREVILTKQNS